MKTQYMLKDDSNMTLFQYHPKTKDMTRKHTQNWC
jgi:hypothetical protein